MPAGTSLASTAAKMRRWVRFSYVNKADVSLISLPRHGQVSIVGLGFSYTAKPEFHGDASFVVNVAGSKKDERLFDYPRISSRLFAGKRGSKPLSHVLTLTKTRPNAFSPNPLPAEFRK